MLNEIWKYYAERKGWIPCRALHGKFRKDIVRSTLREIGGAIVYESREDGTERYKLTFLGILLTNEGQQTEILLVRYLAYIRERFLSDPEVNVVRSNEITSALDLTQAECQFLGQILRISNLFAGGGTWGEAEWSITVPGDVDDLPAIADLRDYVHGRAFRDYDPACPIGDSARMRYFFDRDRISMEGSAFSSLQPESSRNLEVPARPNSDGPDPKKVFVIYGRNEAARRALFAFLRSLHLEPIEWTQAIRLAEQGSPYVGDVLDAALAKAQAIIVLLTGDDLARLREMFITSEDPMHEREAWPQARPNVLFEAGMAFGRAPKRTILIELGQVRPFSDIAGRHVVRIGDDLRTRQDLAMRLEAAGCVVDRSGTDWHSEGDFSATLSFEGVPADIKVVPAPLDVPPQLKELAATGEGIFTKAEGADFGFIWKSLDRYEEFTLLFSRREGKEELSRRYVGELHLQSVVPLLDTLGPTWNLNRLIHRLLPSISSDLEAEYGAAEWNLRNNNFPPLEKELEMYGLVAWGRRQVPAPLGIRLTRPGGQRPEVDCLIFTDRMNRFKYWLAYKGMLPTEFVVRKKTISGAVQDS